MRHTEGEPQLRITQQPPRRELSPYERDRVRVFVNAQERIVQAEAALDEGEQLSAVSIKPTGEQSETFPITRGTVHSWKHMLSSLYGDELRHTPETKMAAEAAVTVTHRLHEHARQRDARHLSDLWNRTP